MANENRRFMKGKSKKTTIRQRDKMPTPVKAADYVHVRVVHKTIKSVRKLENFVFEELTFSVFVSHFIFVLCLLSSFPCLMYFFSRSNSDTLSTIFIRLLHLLCLYIFGALLIPSPSSLRRSYVVAVGLFYSWRRWRRLPSFHNVLRPVSSASRTKSQTYLDAREQCLFRMACNDIATSSIVTIPAMCCATRSTVCCNVAFGVQ